MKKTALPLYAMLVIACLACLQADDNLNLLNLSAYVSGKQAEKIEKSANSIIVAPKIFNCYNQGSSVYALTKGSQYNCCKPAIASLQ